MKKIFTIIFLFLLQITNAQNLYKPLEKESETDFFILNQKQVEEIFNKEPKNFIIELPTSNLTTKKFSAKPSNFKSKDFKIKDSKGNLIKTDKNTIGLIYELFDTQTNENQGIIGIKKNQIDVEIQLKRNFISIHEFDTTRKYKVKFGEIDKAFRDIKKKVEDIKYIYASNDNEIVLRDLAKIEESLPVTTFCSKPTIINSNISNDSLFLSLFRTVNTGSTDDANTLYYNFIYPNGDTTSLTEWTNGFEELNLSVRNGLTPSDSGWYYVRFRQVDCATTLDSIYIGIPDTAPPVSRPTATNEYVGKSGGNFCKSIVVNFDVSYDYYERCNKDASKAIYKVTYVFNHVKKLFDEIAIPLKLGDIRVSSAPEGLSSGNDFGVLNRYNTEGLWQRYSDRSPEGYKTTYVRTAFEMFFCNANIPNGATCMYPSEYRSLSTQKHLYRQNGRSILWEWKNLMYSNYNNITQWLQLNDDSPEVSFLVINAKNNTARHTELYNYGNETHDILPHINLFSNFKNKVDKYTGCYAKFIGCSQRRGLLLNNIADHPYFDKFRWVNFKDLLRGHNGLDTDITDYSDALYSRPSIGPEGVNITNIGILPLFGDSALPTNVTEESTWKKYIYATDNGNGTVVMPDDAVYRWKTKPPTNQNFSAFDLNNNYYRQINTSYPMFNTLNANAYMLIYNLCNLLGVEAKTSEHRNIFNSILSALVNNGNQFSLNSSDLIARDNTIPPPQNAHSAPDFISWDKGFLKHEVDYIRGIFNDSPQGYMDNNLSSYRVPYAKILTNKKNYVSGDNLLLTTEENSSNKRFSGQPYNWYNGQDIYNFTNNLPSTITTTTYKWTGPNGYQSTERENNITLTTDNNTGYGGVKFVDYYLQKYSTNPLGTCSSNVAKIRVKVYPLTTIPATPNLNDWEDLNTAPGTKKFRWALRNWDFIGPFSGTDFETDYIESRRSVGSRIGGLITRKFGTFNALNEPNFISGTGWTNPKGLNSAITWNGLAYQARTHALERNRTSSDPYRYNWPNDAYDGWYARSHDITKYGYAWYGMTSTLQNSFNNGTPISIGNDFFKPMNSTYGGNKITVRYPILAGYDYWRKGKADTARSPIYINTLNTQPVTQNGLAISFNISHAIGQYDFVKFKNTTQTSNGYTTNWEFDGEWNAGHETNSNDDSESSYYYTGVPTSNMYDSLMIYAYFSGGTTPILVYKKSSKDLATIPIQTGLKNEYIPNPTYNSVEWRLETIDLKNYDTCSRVQFDFIYKNGNSKFCASNNLYITNINIGRNIIKRPTLVPDSVVGAYNENNVIGITRCDSIATWTVNLPANHNANQITIQRLERDAFNVWQVVGTIANYTINDPNAPYSQSFNLRYKNYMIGNVRGAVFIRAVARNFSFGATSQTNPATLSSNCDVGQIKSPTLQYLTGYNYNSFQVFGEGKGSMKFILPANHRGKYFRLYGKNITSESDFLWKPYSDLISLPNYNTREIKVNFGITSNEPYTINLPALSSSSTTISNQPEFNFYLYLFNTPQFADFTGCCSNGPSVINGVAIPPNVGPNNTSATVEFPYYYNYSTKAAIRYCPEIVGCIFPPDVTSDPPQTSTGDFTIKIQYNPDHNAIKYVLYESTTSNSVGNAIATVAIPNLNFPFLFTHQILGKPNGTYYYRVQTVYINSATTWSTIHQRKVGNPNNVICATPNIQVIDNSRTKFTYKFSLSGNCPVPDGYCAFFRKCNNSNTGLLATNPNLSIDQVKQLPLGPISEKNASQPDVRCNIKLTQQEISQGFFQRNAIPKLSIGGCWYKIDVICTKCPTANKTTTIYTYVTNN